VRTADCPAPWKTGGSTPTRCSNASGFRHKHLRDANARYASAAMQRLWAASVEATGDACFGLEVGRRWHPTTFHALGYAALASASLREALGYLVRYCRVVTTGASFHMIDRGAEVDLCSKASSVVQRPIRPRRMSRCRPDWRRLPRYVARPAAVRLPLRRATFVQAAEG
jgi:hypothetical protein